MTELQIFVDCAKSAQPGVSRGAIAIAGYFVRRTTLQVTQVLVGNPNTIGLSWKNRSNGRTGKLPLT